MKARLPLGHPAAIRPHHHFPVLLSPRHREIQTLENRSDLFSNVPINGGRMAPYLTTIAIYDAISIAEARLIGPLTPFRFCSLQHSGFAFTATQVGKCVKA